MELDEGGRCSEWAVQGWTSAGDCCLRPMRQGIPAGLVHALLTIAPSGNSFVPPGSGVLLAMDSALRIKPRFRNVSHALSALLSKLPLETRQWTADVKLELHYVDGSHRTATSKDTVMNRIEAGPFTCTESGPPDRPQLIRITLWKA
ncbi:hypothetical protein ACWGDT_05385 [Streptomyces avermitilis]